MKGLTLEGATDAILKQLSLSLAHPDVQVTRPLPDAMPAHELTWRETAPPTASYTIGIGDVLQMHVSGTIPQEPVEGFYLVEPSGAIQLGPSYGLRPVKGLTLEAAEKAIENKLSETLTRPNAQVTFGGWANWRLKQPFNAPPQSGPRR